jgi:hypothetical protein
MSDLFSYEHFRVLNTILAVATVCGLIYRTPEALLGVSSKRLYIVLSLFPFGVGLGTVQAFAKHYPTGPAVVMFTAMFVALGLVETVFWPKALTGKHQ